MGMKSPEIRTAFKAEPVIYGYTAPGNRDTAGQTKIGYTERDAETRIKEQCHTANVRYKIGFISAARFSAPPTDPFTDKEFHNYLSRRGVQREKGTEWFWISPEDARAKLNDYKDRVPASGPEEAVEYALRKEQAEAVRMTAEYIESHEGGEFLWNAKPRFGKTLAAYGLIKMIGAEKALVVTNRPAVVNSWLDDFNKYMGAGSGYAFVSECDGLKGKAGWTTRDEFLKGMRTGGAGMCIEFVSLQDLKGSKYFGDGNIDKLKHMTELEYDILIVDEAHEGVETDKTSFAFTQIKNKFTLHMTGTPFRALAGGKFNDGAVFNWTYADEQAAKAAWDDAQGENPYAVLPKLCLYTYRMSDVIRDEAERGTVIDGEQEEYAFDLNEFFRTENGKFKYSDSVDRFLDEMARGTRYPFSTPELRGELRHTLWLLERVDSAKALAEKLKAHPVFSEYEVVLAAGDGKLDGGDAAEKSFDKVTRAIRENDKTITLSVGQLTTGVTVPEWTAVMMLSNVKSPALYMQAAFRAQNPCLFADADGGFRRKDCCYVFDFDPARTLIIFEEFANNLSPRMAAGGGTRDEREANVRELLNFFPVIGEDDSGELVELDAGAVLTIPRKIKSQEVVRRGFMSNFLFTNIAGIFGGGVPDEVIDIIRNFDPVQEPKSRGGIDPGTVEKIRVNADGDVEISKEAVIGEAQGIFGDKIYGAERRDIVADAFSKVDLSPGAESEAVRKYAELFGAQTKEIGSDIVGTVQAHFDKELKPSDRKRIESEISRKAEKMLADSALDYKVKAAALESEKEAALSEAGADAARIESEYGAKGRELLEVLKAGLQEKVQAFADEASQDAVREAVTKIAEREKKGVEEKVRDHLRGFSRTIPSFLMAYGEPDDADAGTEGTRLRTFERGIPDGVFKEVTGITVPDFKKLRDGGEWTDEATGESKSYRGLFDEAVFDDSIREFLNKKQALADYFSGMADEDIFSYIPPQKTNQIFTPREVVRKMADLLEQENPGCFDDPEKTFLDPYMKSGLYITEIVKRLFASGRLRAEFPDEKERLAHIFGRQVYGIAPTEIIHKIVLEYVLGFAGGRNVDDSYHNLRLAEGVTDAAKNGAMQELIDAVFGGGA